MPRSSPGGARVQLELTDALLASHADVLRGSSRIHVVRRAGTRDETLRMSAWEANALLHCFCCDPQLKLFTDFSMAPSRESLIRINHYFLIARQIYQLQFYRLSNLLFI